MAGLIKPTLTIRFATQADTERLTQFRIAEFKTAKEFELLNPSLLSQQRGHIYIVEQDNHIVSTMQVEQCNNFDDLESRTTNVLPEGFNAYPCFNLTKGATLKELRNTGLNSYLRLLTLYSSIEKGVLALVGTSYENSPRLNLLKDLGYEFYEVEEKITGYIKPNGKVYFFSLHQNKFQSAIEKLVSETKPLLTQFEINNQTKI